MIHQNDTYLKRLVLFYIMNVMNFFMTSKSCLRYENKDKTIVLFFKQLVFVRKH